MRIQTYQRQQGLPASTGTTPMQGMGTAEQGTAKALATLQAATGELAQRSQEAARQTDVMLRTYGMRKAYGEWYTQRASDPTGFATLHQESAAVLEKLGEESLKGVEDPLTQAGIQREIMQYAAEQSPVAMRTGIQQQIDWSRGALEEQMFLRRQEIATALPHERGRLMGQASELLQGAVGAGYISPLDGEKKLRAFVDGVAEDSLMLDIYQDPNGVLERMYSGEFDNMEVASKQRIILNAEKRAESLREEKDAQRRAEEVDGRRIHREVQDSNFGTYYDAVSQGQIPRSALKEALDLGEIRGEQYRTLVDAWDAMAADGGPGNAERTSQMRVRAFRGELRVAEVYQAASVPDGINDKERDELVGLLKNGSAVTQTQEYKRAAKFLAGQLGLGIQIEGLGKQDVAKAELAARELYDRVLAIGDETQAMKIAGEIAARMTQEMGMPLIGVKPRYPTIDDAKRAYRRGEISGEEFDTEAYYHRNMDKP